MAKMGYPKGLSYRVAVTLNSELNLSE